MDILIGQIASAVQLQGFISGEEQLKGSFDLFTLPEHQYEGSYLVTPTESQQVLPTSGRTPLSNITVSPIPSEYVIPSGTVTISQSSGADVAGYASANVASGEASQGTQFGYTSSGTRWRMRGYNNVTSAGWFESGQTQGAWTTFYAVPSGTVVTPSESSQTVGGDDYMMQGAVTVSPIPSEYVIPSGTIEIENGGDTNVAGYETANVPEAELRPDFSASFADVFGARRWVVFPAYTVDSDGWVSASTYWGNHVNFNAVPSGTTVTPTTSSQTIGGSEYMMEDAVTVSPIPSQYIVPSGTITISGDGTTDVKLYESADVPEAIISASYSAEFADYAGGRRWELSPKYTVNSAGWASASTHWGTDKYFTAIPSGTVIYPSTSAQTIGGSNYMMEDAVTVSPIPSQYIVPSGTISISSNGTVDVTQYASASISVPTGTPTLQTKTYTVSNYGSVDITPSAGYDGLSKVTVTTPSGSAKPASSISSSGGATITTETGKIVLSKTVNNVPQVTAGYISAGTFDDTSITLRASCSINGNSALSQSGSTVTALAGYYPSNATITVSGGSSKNVQIVQNSSTRITATTYTKACGTITVSKSGTYDIYWCAYRTSSSGTWGTQWYKNGTAQGSVQSFSSYYQAIHLTNISLEEDDEIDVYGRSRGSNYYLYVGQLTIIEV